MTDFQQRGFQLTGQIWKKKQSCHLDAGPCSYNRSKCKSLHDIPVHSSLHCWAAFIVSVPAVVSKKLNWLFRTKTPEPERAKYSCAHHEYFICIGVSSLASSSSPLGRLRSATQHKIHLEKAFYTVAFMGFATLYIRVHISRVNAGEGFQSYSAVLTTPQQIWPLLSNCIFLLIFHSMKYSEIFSDYSGLWPSKLILRIKYKQVLTFSMCQCQHSMLAFNVSLKLESHMFLCILRCLIKEMLIESVVPVQALVSLIMPALCEKTCASVRKGIKSQALCPCVSPLYAYT